MKVASFRNGGHRAFITTSHRGEWVKLKISDGHTTVEVTLKPEQVGAVIDNLSAERRVAGQLARTAAERERVPVT